MEDIVKEIGRSLVDAEIEKLVKLRREPIPVEISRFCEELYNYLKNSALAETEDRYDLLALREYVDVVSNLVRLFHATSEQRSSWWAKPLLKQCYQLLDLDTNERIILIIHSEGVHSEEPNHFLVYPDLLSNIESKLELPCRPRIDIFHIPLEARHDLASIALVAHEVGHVFIQQHFHLIEQKIASVDLDKHLGIGAESSAADDLFQLEDRKEKRDKIAKRIASQIEEYLCDSIGRYLLGPAFDFSLIKHLVPITNFRILSFGSSSHPPNLVRIRNSLASLKNALRLCRNEDRSSSLSKCLSLMDASWKKLVQDGRSGRTKKNPLRDDEALAINLARTLVKEQKLINYKGSYQLTEAWRKVEPELASFRPPFETVNRDKPIPISPVESLQAAVIYYYGRQYEEHHDFYRQSSEDKAEKVKIVRKILIAHLTYAISLHDFVYRSNSQYCASNFPRDHLQGTLWFLREDVHEGKPAPVVVTPSINPKKQCGYNSIDLRLSPFFLVNKASRYTHIHPSPLPETAEFDAPIEEFYEEVFKPVGGVFVLHPHQFILGSTLEYVCLPSQYYALVLGRSTWGRLGLNIATATTVQAGFKGCLTLELRNLGETPLPLTVGTRIAQLCLINVPTTSISAGYFVEGGKYVGPVKPEIPKIREDADWEILL